MVVARNLQRLSRRRPTLAIILGSGFHHLTASVDPDAEVDYADLPGFPRPGVKGHAGKLLIGRMQGTAVLVLSGRAHYYEGFSFNQVTFPVQVLAACAITDLLLTNAAGAVNRRFHAGDFMILQDHINFMGANPLRGYQPGSREANFLDLTCAYDPALRQCLRRAGRAAGIRLASGVYLAVSGPNYETPAEIKAFARLGADAVGMSTVPEVLVARRHGLRVAGLSCITNLAAGLAKTAISHGEVLDIAERSSGQAARIISAFARLYGTGKGQTGQ